MLIFEIKPFMLNVFILSAVMLTVVAPNGVTEFLIRQKKKKKCVCLLRLYV